MDLENTSHPPSIYNPTDGDAQTREKGKSEFLKFVKNTFDGLYMAETRSLSAKSSIGIFCRMDVGIMRDRETKKMNYFVNEIERTLTCTLWVEQGHMAIGTFGTTFAKHFYTWLTRITTIP